MVSRVFLQLGPSWALKPKQIAFPLRRAPPGSLLLLPEPLWTAPSLPRGRPREALLALGAWGCVFVADPEEPPRLLRPPRPPLPPPWSGWECEGPVTGISGRSPFNLKGKILDLKLWNFRLSVFVRLVNLTSLLHRALFPEPRTLLVAAGWRARLNLLSGQPRRRC